MAEPKDQSLLEKDVQENASAKKHGGARPYRIKDPLLRPPPRRIQTNQSKKFFSWWNEVHQKDPDRLTGEVYRDYPKENRPKGESCVLHLTEPPGDEMDFYANPELGCGDYRVYLNDSREKGKTWTTLILKGYRNYRDYPPFVSLDYLDWEDANNRPYITAMQSMGRIPGREDYEMQARQTEERSAVSELTGLLRDMMREKGSQRQPGPDAATQAGIFDLYAAAQNRIIKMVADGAEEASKLRQQPQQEPTPTSQLREVVDVLKPLLNPKPSGTDSDKWMQMILEDRASHQKELSDLTKGQMDELRAEIKALREKPPEGELDKLLALRKKLSELGLVGEGGGASETDKIERYLQYASMLLPALQGTLAHLATLAYNTLVVGRNPNAQPIQPTAEQPQHPSRQIQPGAPTEQQQVQVYLQFIDSIAEAIVNHVQSDHLTGEDFADWMIRSKRNGLGIYRALKEQENPKQVLLQLLQAHQALWSEIGAAPQTLDRFLDEFLSYEDQPEGDTDDNHNETKSESSPETVPVS